MEIAHRIDRAFRIFIRLYSLFKSERLSANLKPILHEGRAIAQAVSRWLPTAAVRGSKPDLGM
jgi:hypothetical protein